MEYKPDEIVEILKDRSVIDSHRGMKGLEVLMDKSVLKEAAEYLEFYRKIALGRYRA